MKKIVVLLVVITLIITGCTAKKTTEVTDSEIFAAEYKIGKNNVFKYATIDDIEKLFTDKDGIVFFGNPDNKESLEVAEFINNVIKKTTISEIYYCNPVTLKDKKPSLYDKFIIKEENNEYDENASLFTDSEEDEEKPLETNELEDKTSYDILIPSLYFIKNGEIYYYDFSFSGLKDKENVEVKLFLEELTKKYTSLIGEYLND